ncbi:MAG: NYN domain-containing protein [bacterium]|nr:NYN domain-containing protein [bacterium]
MKKNFFEKFNKPINVKNNAVYVFIDGSNLWEAQKAKGRFLDYEKTVDFIRREFKASALRVFYYTAYPATGTRNYCLDGRHRFLTYLKKGLGFEVRKKELKRISVVDEHGESIKEKGNMDIEIAIDVLHNLKKFNTAIFFTGDSDFLALVVYLKSFGKKVFIFSSQNNISEELRTGGDGYSDVLKIDNIWGKKLRRRNEISGK